jgi:hypothetical protein
VETEKSKLSNNYTSVYSFDKERPLPSPVVKEKNVFLGERKEVNRRERGGVGRSDNLQEGRTMLQ